MADFQLPEDRKTPIDAPAFIREVVEGLLERGDEFPIKVEGATTLPYTSIAHEIHKDHWVLKLQRALPPELLKGALFHFVMTHGEQRFEGLIPFQGREGYLQYRYGLPKQMFLADRRRHKRYPFRPRENVFVTITDGHMAASGPMASLSIGGLGLRVDRIVELETHARLKVDTALFERGRAFDVKIQDLQKAPYLELRGRIAGAYDLNGVVHLGCEFTGLTDVAQASLESALRFREIVSKGAQSVLPEKEAKASGRKGSRGPESDSNPGEPAQAEPTVSQPMHLLRLKRRCVPLSLLMAEGPQREELRASLTREGYFRLKVGASTSSLPPADVVLAPEAMATGVEGALPFEADEQVGALVRRLDSALGLRL
ncbi:MAG TPA: PilZ domain-containing protein [Holophagaceae bacterium]|nr:PilZ domain-containing protein [Holophagaceae bacterium]